MLWLWSSLVSYSQNQETLFPTLEGSALLEAIQQQYTPTFVQTYSVARDSLFGRIDVVEDSLRCVYTGYTLYLDPSQDPTIFVFMNGAGINTEHTYPQAKGAEQEPAKADMHHLFPTRVDVNAIRNNFPFAEIPDQLTQKWYYKDQVRSSIPTSNMAAYSEYRDGAFEPPEQHKGNVARAMFYFYTIYRKEAMTADPSYFAAQMSTLCDWNAQDPVDEAEWNRTWSIAHYQDNKPNPFVLDCSLANRLYCENTAITCLLDVGEPGPRHEEVHITPPYPNPFQKQVVIPFELTQTAKIRVSLYNGIGQLFHQQDAINFPPGKHEITLNASEYHGIKAGLCWAKFSAQQEGSVYQRWLKLIFLP